MQVTFQTALNFVLQTEGGYVNDPEDNGGATNQGITQRVYDAWRTHEGLVPRSVKDINSYEVAVIYKLQYWDAVKGDFLPAGVDYCVFDFAVNSGPTRAIECLQRALNVADDGHIGFVTLTALKLSKVKDVIDNVCNERLDFMQHLHDWPHFQHGWTARVDTVQTRAEGLIQ